MKKFVININKEEIMKLCPYFDEVPSGIESKLYYGLNFKYKPLRDVCFIWPFPKPITLGSLGVIEIPEQFRDLHKTSYGILLAIGPGYQDDKGKYHSTQPDLIPGTIVLYDKSVPWFIIDHINDQEILVVMCGEGDIKGIIE